MKPQRYETMLDADCDVLCWRWNALTDPSDLRTDEEHAWCRDEAARVQAAIVRRFIQGVDYEASEYTGRLIPLGRRY